ncbi:MAG: HAMP domain-containing sensor histidine kinase [Acidobacteriota bacterium]
MPRTVGALVLTVIAVAGPCVAWWIAGRHQVEREALLDNERIAADGAERARLLAGTLSNQLRQLVATEELRPFVHYQSLFHDPEGASEGRAISVSPLARGPFNPLVEVYFQIDETGGLTLPSINETFPELRGEATRDDAGETLFRLRDVEVLGAPLPAQAFRPSPDARIVRMEERSWWQHLRAEQLYGDLKFRGGGAVGQPLQGQRATSNDSEASTLVEVRVEPFGWQTLPVDLQPALVALRRVETPVGAWTQGFVISNEAVAQLLDDTDVAARFEPKIPDVGPVVSTEVATAIIDGTPWRVAVSLGARLAEARQVHKERWREFLHSFALGALIAAAAGALVVVLVWQSERLARSRAQFAASAAHELRTPLAGLRLYGEMLAEGLGDPARSRHYARRIGAEAERLGRVVTNVLSFSRLERGSLGIDPRPGDLQAAVSEAVARQSSALEEAGARLELSLDDVPAAIFDPDAVGHIVQNLLDNAEKYTRGVDDRQVRIGLRQQDREIVLSVVDDGPGVPRSLRRRLFRPFTRGVGEGAPEGLGLGLVLVRRLARAQGADVSYRDAEGGGADFRVAFRAA